MPYLGQQSKWKGSDPSAEDAVSVFSADPIEYNFDFIIYWLEFFTSA